jgi:predicted metal-dependent hydrolase
LSIEIKMEIKIIRSNKRAKTVTARVIGDVLEILSPAHCTDAELQPIVDKLRLRIEKKQQKFTCEIVKVFEDGINNRTSSLTRFDAEMVW